MTPKTRLRIFILAGVFMGYFAPAKTALSPQMVESSKKVMKNMCINKSGVKPDVLAAIQNGQFAEDQKLKCYISCCLNFMKIMKKDQITYDMAKKQITTQLPQDMREPLIAILNECKDVTGVDGCDVAMNYVKCGYKLNPTRRVVPS